MPGDIKIELEAAKSLLDQGFLFEVQAPFVLRIFGRKRFKIHVPQPRSGVLYRITAQFLRMGVDVEKLDGMTMTKALGFFHDHVKTVTRICATAMLGYYGGKLFTAPLAGYLFRHSRPADLFLLFYSLMMFSGVEDFLNTIRLISTTTMTAPRNLSPNAEGS